MNDTTTTTKSLPFTAIIDEANRILARLEASDKKSGFFMSTRLTRAGLAFLEHADSVQVHNNLNDPTIRVSLI